MSEATTKDVDTTGALDQVALRELIDRALDERAQEDGYNKKNKITIIAWDGHLDRIWPTLILSSTAAASGMEVSVFFTFWGLFPLVKNDVRITGENWMQKMMSVMNPGSADKAKLSHYQFMGAGPAMFKKLADQHNVAKPDELIALAQELGVKLIPCQMTMDLLGLKREDLLDGLEEPIGAAIIGVTTAITLRAAPHSDRTAIAPSGNNDGASSDFTSYGWSTPSTKNVVPSAARRPSVRARAPVANS